MTYRAARIKQYSTHKDFLLRFSKLSLHVAQLILTAYTLQNITF